MARRSTNNPTVHQALDTFAKTEPSRTNVRFAGKDYSAQEFEQVLKIQRTYGVSLEDAFAMTSWWHARDGS